MDQARRTELLNDPQVVEDAYELHLGILFEDLRYTEYGKAFGQPTLHVSFSIDAKEWKRMRDKGNLGQLYGIDLGNFLSRKGILKEYCVPIVSDRKNARDGRKSISVEYRLKGHPYGGRP